MAKDSELDMTLKYITGIDISFVIDDIIGDYVDPNIPVNIDENFSIDVDTPHGICNIATKYVEDHYEVIFKRFISETYYEEYKLNLNYHDEDFLKLEGNTIELRDKGYVIKDIEKRYETSDVTKDIQGNGQADEKSTVKVNSLVYVSKKQRVYSKKDVMNYHNGEFMFKEIYGDPSPYEMLDIFKRHYFYERKGFIGLIYYPTSLIYPEFGNTVTVYEKLSDYNSKKCVEVIINGGDYSYLYPILDGDNIVRRVYNLYEGIINQENYDDALHLIKNYNFSEAFSYEDYKIYIEETKSINEVIASLVGNLTVDIREEYSKYIMDIVDKCYKYVKLIPILFKFDLLPFNKQRELRRNTYIKEIILNKHGKSHIKEGDKNGKR